MCCACVEIGPKPGGMHHARPDHKSANHTGIFICRVVFLRAKTDTAGRTDTETKNFVKGRDRMGHTDYVHSDIRRQEKVIHILPENFLHFKKQRWPDAKENSTSMLRIPEMQDIAFL